ncbi:hypothetical protein MRB53_020315 [Persea americana]|uniref:Uncharacterized protein n=1 Tax=Persea americana TaxID=3435 RepID=A0ACC2L183_PERAE|nr:hypothetical protein MRB53_020315 [Persea americana]
MADMVRCLTEWEEWRRWASFRAKASGCDCLQMLKSASAWDRWSFAEDMRWEMRVSNWEGSGPRIAAMADLESMVGDWGCVNDEMALNGIECRCLQWRKEE